MFKIGNVVLKNNVVLAPMAGVCNSAFRRIVKEYGVGLIEAEMVSDKALVYDSEKTKKMLYMTEEERPISQQIFGSDKESFVIAAKINESIPNSIGIIPQAAVIIILIINLFLPNSLLPVVLFLLIVQR